MATPQEIDRLHELENMLLPDALLVGPMHANWEFISDIRSTIDGKFSRIQPASALIDAIEEHINRWGI